MKIVFHTLCFLFLFFSASAQDLSLLELKQPITEKDHATLLKFIRRAFEPEVNLQFEYSTTSASPDLPLKGEPASTEKDLTAIIGNLKNDPENIDLLIAAGNVASSLNRPKAAQHYFSKAIDKIAREAKIHPDDASLYEKAGHCYNGLGNYEMIILSYEKALQLDPHRDTISRYFLPVAYLNTGFYIKLEEFTSGYLKKEPDDKALQLFYTFGDLYSLLQQGFDYGVKTPEEYFKDFTVFDKVDTSFLNKMLQKNPDDITYQQFLQGIELYGLLLKIYATYDLENRKIILDDHDKQLIKKLRAFHTNLLKKRRIKNTYLSNLSLGLLSVFESDFKTAVNYFETCIESLPKEIAGTRFNSYAAYDNIAFCYINMKDTVNAEKTLDRKIKDMPALRKDPVDYYDKAFYNIYNNKIAAARINAGECYSADSNFVKAELLHIAIDIHENDLKKAQERLETIYSSFQNDYYYNFLYGMIMLMKNDATMAKIFFGRAIAIAPRDKLLNQIITRYFKTS